MNKRPKFRELRKFLEGLGFHYTRLPDCMLFEHADSDSVVVLRLYRSNEVVRPPDLSVVRATLDYRGLVEKADFEQALLTVKA